MLGNRNVWKVLQSITCKQCLTTKTKVHVPQQLLISKQSISNRNFSTTNISFSPRFIKHAVDEDETFDKTRKSAKLDIDTLTEIESDLFENKTKIPVSINTNQYFKKGFQFEKTKEHKNRHYNNQKPQIPKGKTEAKIIEDSSLGLKFIKLENNDTKFGSLLMIARSKNKRNKINQKIVIEGRRIILEAIACGLKLEHLIFSQKDQVELIKHELQRYCKEAEIYKVSHHNLKTWSSLTTPPGIIGIFERPSYNKILINLRDKPLPLSVICDNIREPNNIGAIIRTCAALPCTEVYIPKGCCDPWESKALRSGCGGQFRIKIKDNVDWEEIHKIIPEDTNVFIAENNLNSNNKKHFTNYSNIKVINNFHNTVIIGGETHGISEAAYHFMDTRKNNSCCIHIPLANGIESLNTSSALTLILYELRKKIMENNLCFDLEVDKIEN